MQGTISAESILGDGTTFCVKLKLESVINEDKKY